jgi:2-alkyl-3-oxoalkanoate reductase
VGPALVTGGGGFLGRALVRRLLDRGIAVRSLARGDYPELRGWGAETMVGSVDDPFAVGAAVRDCEVVFHTAAKVGTSMRRAAFVRTNVDGTQAILDACRQHGVAKLVYTSTPSVVHAGGDLEGVDESVGYPPHFDAHYPATKAEAERRVLAANGEGLSTVALRPHLVWGPGDTNLLPRLIARAKAGRLRLVGDAPKKIDTTYIDNAVDAHVLAAMKLQPGAACAGRAYFIANDEPIPQDDMIRRLLAVAGLPPPSRRISTRAARAIGAVLEFVYWISCAEGEPIMTRWLADQLSSAHWFDLGAARRDLGYAPSVTLDEGLRRLAASLEGG